MTSSSGLGLHNVAKVGNIGELQRLLKAGACLEVRDDQGQTPLHIAAGSGRKSVVQLLIDAGANIEATDKSKKNKPLHYACAAGDASIVQLLIDSGATIEGITSWEHQTGPTLLALACAAGHASVVKTLIHNGANIQVSTTCPGMKSTITGRDLLLTPIHIASANGHTSIVKMLVDAGANVEARNSDFQTPLHIASDAGHESVVRRLVHEGSRLEAREYFQLGVGGQAKTHNDATPLFIASARGHEAVVAALLQNGANVDAMDESGTTPLFAASLYGHGSVVKLLIEAGANLEMRTTMGFTPLHIAQNETIVKLLINAGADVHALSTSGMTPYTIATSGNNTRIGAIFEHAMANPTSPQISRTKLLRRSTTKLSSKQSTLQQLRAAYERGQSKTLKILLKSFLSDNETEEATSLEECADKQQFELLSACKNGQVTVARKLIAAGVKPNVLDEDGLSPLTLATQNGHDVIVSTLIDAGLTADAAETAILLACSNKQAVVVQQLIDSGVNLDITDDFGNTPLILATKSSSNTIVQLLIARGANTNAAEIYQRTALHWASLEGLTAITRMLLEVGSELEAVDYEGRTPLMLAAQSGHISIVRILLDAGANPLMKDKHSLDALRIASKHGHNEVVAVVNKSCQKGPQSVSISSQYILSDNMTRATSCGLASAAEIGDIPVIQIQILAGANVNSVDERGWTPLMHAACFGQSAAVSALIDSGATASIEVTEIEDNRTAVYLACLFGHESSARLLIKARAYVDVTDMVGRTPLMVAASKRYDSIVNALIQAGAKIEAKDSKGWTALLWASFKDCSSTAKMLIQAGANIQATTSDGKTALMIASSRSHEGIVALLISSGADVNATDCEGKTALHIACEEGLTGVARLLINANANLEAVDRRGWSPLKMAIHNGHSEIVQLLTANNNAKLAQTVQANIPKLKKALESKDANAFVESLGSMLDGMLQLASASFSLAAQPSGASPSLCASQASESMSSLSLKDNVSVHPITPSASIEQLKTPERSESISIEVLDDLESFPVHLSVQCSNGDIHLFKTLMRNMTTKNSDPNAAMWVEQTSSGTTTEMVVTASEYAFLLGYRDIAAVLAQQMALDL